MPVPDGTEPVSLVMN